MMEKIIKVSAVILLILIVAAAVLFGQHTKKSFINNVDFNSYINNPEVKVMYDYYPFDKDYDIYGDGSGVETYEDLESQADVVIKGRLDADAKREIYVECVLSHMEVDECYKGNLGSGDQISIFEPINCTGIKDCLLCAEGYAPMTENTEYIMYLRRVKNSLFGSDKYIYIPASIRYGKFKANRETPKLFSTSEFDDVKTINYQKYKDNEIFLFKKKDFHIYMLLKEAAWSATQL